jgi:tape measure domain-containing protein
MAFEELLVQISSKLDEKGFKQLDKAQTKAIKKTNALSRSLKNMFVGVMGTFAVKSIVDATVKLDTLQRSMTALAGSEEGGKSQLSYLRQEAERLGQSFETIADSYKNLFAAGVGAGWSSTDIQNVFSSVLEAGTVLGSSKQQIGGALLALEQMISKGKVSMEELRRQLGNALPGAMQIGAKAMGVTSEQFQEMLKNGLESEMFVKRFAQTLHQEYGQKSVLASKSLRAELERLGNAVFFLQTALLDGENMEGVAEAIREITKLISSPVFLQGINQIGKLVAFLAKNIKLIVGLTVIVGLRRIWQQLILLRLELLTTTFAVGSLGAGMQLIVGGSVIAGLRTITGIFLAWLTPLLKIALILGVIIELVDTLRGKDTLTSEYIKNAPTLEEIKQGEKFQRIFTEFKKEMVPWSSEYKMKNAPVLGGDNLKSQNSATVIINAGNADSQQVANLVRSSLANAFNNYEEIYA